MLTIAHWVPTSIGFPIVKILADWISSREELPMVKAIRSNQRGIHQNELTDDQLSSLTRETVRNIAYSMYTMFHYWNNNKALQDMIKYSPESELLIKRSRVKKDGTMVVFVHSSNFDVALKAASSKGLNGLVLSLPETDEAIEWQHDLRESSGIEVKPATLAVLREATRRLESGETVVTGVDRPMPESKYHPRFFGRPTPLPVHYIYLALKTKVPVSVATAIRDEKGFFHILASELVRMQPHEDRFEEVIQNAERILKIAENYILMAPTQWAMLHPLWPDKPNK